MRSGNQMDGMYFFLLFAPIVLSILGGDFLRKRIIYHLRLDCFWSQNLSATIGVSVQVLIMITGVLVGYLLVKLI
jgi:hypothetical protein